MKRRDFLLVPKTAPGILTPVSSGWATAGPLFHKSNMETIDMFPLSGQKWACQCMPGPVVFPLSLAGFDCASSVLPLGQRPGFFAGRKPWAKVGQSGPTGARGVIMNKGRVSPCLESISTADHFRKLAARL